MKVLFPDAITDEAIGGKAAALLRLRKEAFRIPEWFVVLQGARPSEITSALARLNADCVAVRSSALEEDGAEHSFAGQFDSFLHIQPDAVVEHVEKVWGFARNEHIVAYCQKHNIQLPSSPCAIVQRMLDPESAGVAFSVDPVSGNRAHGVVSSVRGVGEKLVSGECDADTFHISKDGCVIKKSLCDEAITETQAVEVAELSRQCEDFFDAPQDIEWAFAEGALHLLQSRPITSLRQGTHRIWDNSNISESYSGVTTPLTFTFANRVYTAVYRQFCKMMLVPGKRVVASDETFRAMLGLLRGRVYYNLVSWYRVLAMLPGFQVNRSFMEQMMGVKTPMPQEIVDEIIAESKSSKLADTMNLIGTQIKRFYTRLNDTLAAPAPLEKMSIDQLTKHYRHLEKELLTKWDAPLVNDFFAMIFFGVLGKLCRKWLGEEAESLHNDLIVGGEDIVSMEPAKRIREMAIMASSDDDLIASLQEAVVAPNTNLSESVHAYIEKFGDRCLEELKLESATLLDNPALLLQSIGNLAAMFRDHGVPEVGTNNDVRTNAEERLASAGLRFPKKQLFRWVLRQAWNRVRDRENLRFERTRVFGRVRRIMVEIGKRLVTEGRLKDPRDVFYLELEEILGYADGTGASVSLGDLAEARKREFTGFKEKLPPPDRFSTYGAPHDYETFESEEAKVVVTHGDALQGIGCCAGVIRGRARVVTDPKSAVLKPGEILVAQQTDPGWVMLFPSASGLLVERGSLLSHSAIVSREMGIPAVVSLPGLLQWITDGEMVELNGRTGTVRKLTHV
jgi:phosphohistidine swiveling domain-containing protein